MKETVIEILDTSNIIERPSIEGTLLENRRKINQRADDEIKITIFIQAYNRLEKTKACVESVIKHTANHKYKMLLLDNGSDDGTFEYFKELNIFPKKIIRLTENKGSPLASKIGIIECDTKYLASLTNDAVVTKNWLDNLLKCAESDDRIGQVNPIVSNSDQFCLNPLPNLATIEEAEAYGEIHNRSDSRLWAERLRCASICCLLKKDVIDAACGIDVGYYHDFLEDDFQIKMRQAGYKLVFAEDTFVHHNHTQQERNLNLQQGNMSLNAGYRNYIKKHRGINSWKDMNYYIFPYLNNMQCNGKSPRILGIDARCGQPILDFKNRYWRESVSVKEENLFAYTRQAIYYDMLRTITDNVVCDPRPENLMLYYEKNSFDAIVIGEMINAYHRPLEFLKDVLGLLKKGGTLVVPLYNVYDFYMIMAGLVNPSWRIKHGYAQLHCYDIMEMLQKEQVEYVELFFMPYEIGEEVQDFAKRLYEILIEWEVDKNTYQELFVKQYWFCIRK